MRSAHANSLLVSMKALSSVVNFKTGIEVKKVIPSYLLDILIAHVSPLKTTNDTSTNVISNDHISGKHPSLDDTDDTVIRFTLLMDHDIFVSLVGIKWSDLGHKIDQKELNWNVCFRHT